MPDTARVGLIGCGGIAARHVQWLLAREDCRITALCDRSREAVEDKLAAIAKLRPGETPATTDDHHELPHGEGAGARSERRSD